MTTQRLHTNVHSSLFLTVTKLKAAQTPISEGECINKLAYSCHGIPLSNKKEESNMCNRTNDPQDNVE